MNDYLFVYRDANRRYNYAANPVFIASHTMCRAVLKTEIENNYETWGDFIYDANLHEPSTKTLHIINKLFNT